MRKILLGIDLAICSLWTIAALGSRIAWVATPATWIVMLLIMSRLLLSFTLYHRERKSWVSGLLFMGLTAFAVSTELDIKLNELASKVFPLLNIDFDQWCYVGLTSAVATWLWVVPLVVFLVNFFRKGCLTDTLTWKDAFGKLLWTVKAARTFCSLLLITIGTLYAGLALNARQCLFACVVAPTLSFHLLKRYYVLEKGKVWALVISMLIIFFAQTHAGLLRMAMLGISFSIVIYVYSVSYTPETIVCDSLVRLEWCMLKSLSYTHNANTNDSAVYCIHVTLARENMPKPKEAEMLGQKISCFLKKVDIMSTILPLSYNER